MCFYYALTKKKSSRAVDAGLLSPPQLSLFEDNFLVNGFEHPPMPVITSTNPESVSFFRWGLIPSNIRDQPGAASFLKSYNTLNAKAETLLTSRMYADLVIPNRCIVLCSGFFEWRWVMGKKIPYFISLKDDSIFAFAGLWSRWVDELDQNHFTYTIITTQANELMAQVHNSKLRMPLMLEPEHSKTWLNRDLMPRDIQSILKPIPTDRIKAHTVKQFLGDARAGTLKEDIIAHYSYPGVDEINLEGS